MGKKKKKTRRARMIPWTLIILSFILALFLGADGLPALLRLAPATATSIVAPVPTVTLDKEFANADAGYHVAYPSGWTRDTVATPGYSGDFSAGGGWSAIDGCRPTRGRGDLAVE